MSEHERKDEIEDLDVEATEGEDVKGGLGTTFGMDAMQSQQGVGGASAQQLAQIKQTQAMQDALGATSKAQPVSAGFLSKLKGMTGR